LLTAYSQQLTANSHTAWRIEDIMNKKLKFLLVTTISIIALFVLALPSFAQGSPITAVIDRSELSTDESLVLTVTVQGLGSSVSEPEIPYLDGLNIVGSGRSSQISIANGNTSSSTLYQYRLQPARPGDVVIPPISVIIDGQTYSTEPIAVRVTQGGGAAQPQSMGQAAPAPANGAASVSTELNGQDLFVEAAVDNAAPYQGEAIDYTFRFYQAVNLFRDPNYQPPSFTGFWTDGEPVPNRLHRGSRRAHLPRQRSTPYSHPHRQRRRRH
jgi:hypothetical protein